MEWLDLEENDILEYNSEFLENYKIVKGSSVEEHFPVIKPFLNQFHVVRKIVTFSLNHVNIYFKNMGDGEPPVISIRKSGSFSYFKDGPPIFNIVSISKEI